MEVDRSNLSVAKFRHDKRRNTFVCDYTPLPHQKIFHESPAEQLLLGGAAGPGKSIALRFDCYFFCLSSPGLKAYLFRRTIGELRSNHIDYVKTEIPKELAEYNKSTNSLRFKNGSILYFAYCADDQDVHNYQGAEIHLLAIDEASHLSEYQHNYLRGRVRLGSFVPSDKDRAFLPRIAYGSNPGNVGHNFLKRIFVDQCVEPNKIFYDKYTELPERKDINGNILPAEKGMSTIYIPCNFHSNPYIDASYERQFAGLPPEQIRSLVMGDWDAAVGQAFWNLSREKHMVPDFFDTPDFRKQFGHYTIIQGYDHGSASPGASLWGLIPNEDLEIVWTKQNKTIIIPADSFVLFKEWFIAAPNTDNTGAKLPPEAIARKILQLEKEWNITPDVRVADYSIRSTEGGPSIESVFLKHGIHYRMAKKNRVQMYAETISRLAGNPNFQNDSREGARPMLYICEGLEHWWRLTPPLVLDEKQPEKGLSKTKQQSDHLADAMMYMLMERPHAYSRQERRDEEWEFYKEEYMKAKLGSEDTFVDPYAT